MGHHETRTGFAFARVQEHVEELRRFFDLPPDELFLDEFYCALYKRILLQGRMYIFEHYLCFYANVFGWVKRKVIPLKDIKDVTKKRNYGFPNSIEVVWKKKEFFTSFLNRSNAFTLLCEAVKHVRESSSFKNSLDSKSSSNSQYILAAETNRQMENYGHHSSRGSNEKGSDGGDEDSDMEGDDEDFDPWIVIPGEAPTVPENMEMLCENKYDVSVQEFFRRSLSLDSAFLDEYHKQRGDCRYTVSQWEQLHEISGSVRQATFVSPVKGVRGIGFMSPKTTVCNQDHRLRIYDGNHLVFEISQVMKDIPYGDTFTVEHRWDVIPDENSGCRITIHVAVPFIRSVMAPFRSIIESNVMKEMQGSVKMMTQMLEDIMSKNEEDSEDISEDQNTVLTDYKETAISAHLLEKLEVFLANEDGARRLEQMLNSKHELPGKQISGSYEAAQPPSLMHQNTTTMNIQSPPMASTNWILLLCCFVMLFCQIILVVLWTNSGHRTGATFQSSKTSDLVDFSIQRIIDLEQNLASLIQLLNGNMTSIKAQS